MRNCIFFAFFAFGPLTVASAQTIPAPALSPGDSWTYENGVDNRGSSRRVTHDVITLNHADSRLIAVEVHTVGINAPGPERLMGPDWSRVRSVNGRQTVVNRPLSFPLSPGKSWTVAYSETNPSNRAHAREQFEMVFKVSGWQDITVLAGTFHALKIEGEGTWTADLPSNLLVARGRAPNGADVAVSSRQGPRVTSGRFYKAFWYVPTVHRWVKSEESFYDTNGVRNQQMTSELEAFTLANPAGAEAPAGETGVSPVDATKPPRHAKAHRAPKPPVTLSPKVPPPLPSLQETRGIEASPLHRS